MSPAVDLGRRIHLHFFCALLLFLAVTPLNALERREEPWIVGIHVFGNRIINRSSIIAASGLKPGEKLTQERLFEAKRRILATGNFGGWAKDPDDGVKVQAEVTGGEARIVITVIENEVVRGFEITGSGPIPPEEVLRIVEPLKHSVLNLNVLQRKVGEIRAIYEDRGFQGFVTEELEIRDGILRIPITVGRVGEIWIDGVHPALAHYLKSLLRTHPGGCYNVNDVRRFLLLLGAWGLEPLDTDGLHCPPLKSGLWLRLKDPRPVNSR